MSHIDTPKIAIFFEAGDTFFQTTDLLRIYLKFPGVGGPGFL